MSWAEFGEKLHAVAQIMTRAIRDCDRSVLPVSMPARLPSPFDRKAHVQIHSRAEEALSVTREYDTFYSVVGVEERVGVVYLVAHGFGEGIVVLGSVELEDEDRGGRW